jgi:dUTP pyrophosphatase
MSSNNTMKSSLNSTSTTSGEGKKKIPTVSESSIPNTVSETPPKPSVVVDEPKKVEAVPPTPKPVAAVAEKLKKDKVEPVSAPAPAPEPKKAPIVATPPVKAKLLVKKLDPNAVLPERKSDGAAGYDICCLEKRVILPPNSHKLVSTGLSFTVPEGTYGQLASRSGLSVKGVSVGAGVIDRDYTGEVKVLLFNHTSEKVYLNEKDRIAQLIIKKIELPVVEEVESLETTVRGENGFGSTDKK